MGCNYYAVRNRPTVRSPVHIGKSSYGWLFLFHQQNDNWCNPPIAWNTYNQVKEWLKKYTVDSQEFVIMDEEDRIVSFDEFFEMVDSKQNDESILSNNENFLYCRNVDGYRFTDGEFC